MPVLLLIHPAFRYLIFYLILNPPFPGSNCLLCSLRYGRSLETQARRANSFNSMLNSFHPGFTTELAHSLNTVD